jgi:NAD(P)-dependent dehydrogenase (short-subunit alcohol dehydrogenase family)
VGCNGEVSKNRTPRAVVVTGASSGVGRAIARAFATRGDRVGLVARGEDGLDNAAREVEQLGGEPMVLPLDVADPDAVEAAARQVERTWGGIDVWVNDAMVTVFSPVHEMRPDEYRRVTEVTYLGTVHGTLAALRRMRPARRGVIIQVGSALAYRSIPLQSAYCAAKAAIRGFTDSLRCELLHDGSGVALTMLQLPAVNTPQFDVSRTRMPRQAQPVPPIYQPEVIARAALYAADHPCRELWIGHSTYQAILGQRLAPGLLDRYLARTGYEAQQTDQEARVGRPDNLDEPLPGDRGAHGRFDDRARSRSPQLWLRTHRLAAAALALPLVAGLASGSLLTRSRRRDKNKETHTWG